MSRKIDLSQPLSDEDRQYLADRDRHRDITENDAVHGEGEVRDNARRALGLEVVNDGHTGDVDPFTVDDGRDAVETLNPGQVGLTPTQRQRAMALEEEESDTEYDVDGQTELQRSAVGGPPRTMGATGEEVPQPPDSDDVPFSEDPNPERAGDTGEDAGADLRAEATANALSQGDEEALERAQDLPGRQMNDNYDQLNKDQLREEAGRRNPPLAISGTIPELKARLRAWDREHAS